MRRWRRLWIGGAALVALLLAGDTLYWRFVTGKLDAGFHAWIAAQRAAGWTVQASPPQPGGWPLAATLGTGNVKLSGGELDFPGGIAWHADRLVLRVDLLDPRRLEAIPGGNQRLRLGDAPAIDFTATAMRAEVPLRPGEAPHEVMLDATDLRAQSAADTKAAALTIGHLRARLDTRPAGQARPALAITADATALTLPARFRWALGATVQSLHLDGTLTGPFPPAADIAARAAAWRDRHGALDLNQLALHWGPLDLSATATLGLDQQLQPAGHANARVIGYDGTLDALAKAGALTPSAALAAKALLSLMAKPAANGQPAEVEVPLRLQQRTLFMRDFPLLRLPELDWSRP